MCPQSSEQRRITTWRNPLDERDNAARYDGRGTVTEDNGMTRFTTLAWAAAFGTTDQALHHRPNLHVRRVDDRRSEEAQYE
jgi:hypothetical protein